MGRRRRSESLGDVLIALPWWVSVAFGLVAFAGLRWILPAMLPPLFQGVTVMLPTFSWFALAMFGFFALLSLLRSAMASKAEPASRKHTARARSFATKPNFPLGPDAPRAPVPAREPSVHAIPQPATSPTPQKIDTWTVEALRALEWKRFELLCAKYYEAVGFQSQTIRCGADGGIDVKLFRNDPNTPLAIVQCKAWNSAVGVKEVRELLGVMTHEKVARSIFITTGSYTKDALRFSEDNPIQLLDGPAFIGKIQELPKEKQDDLLKFAFEGDYSTPTCASCGIKMAKRESKRGAFWGCTRYPKCRNKIYIKGREPVEAA